MSRETALLTACIAADGKDMTFPRGLIRLLVELAEDPDHERRHEGHRYALWYVKDQMGDYEREAHMAYVSSFLHYDGARKHELNRDIKAEALTLCDGMGKVGTDEPDLLYDWSHVRDSSVEALAECRAYIEGILEFAKEA